VIRYRFLISLLLTAGCSGERDGQLFRLLSARQTGIAFENTITTNDSVNVQTEVYVYNGAGVAIGDVNNDGLSDIFFSGNMVSSRLYLNKGEMRFEDVTQRARVGTNRWASGATMVDINNDGNMDIYVSMSGAERSNGSERANSLFINNGDLTFTESAARYGVADTGFTTHSVFLDYDGDKCLDLFVLNNSPRDFSRGAENSHPTGVRGETPGSHNELYRNSCAGTFTNVSSEAGILRTAGYGLGVVVSDLNRDGWPDIYVSNDATPNDVVYVNNKDGTFTDKAGRWIKHGSFAGMGVDAADFNNDGWVDILQVDMMPHAASRRKRISGFMSYERMLQNRRRGFRDDYSVNTLQLSNGVTKEGDVVFSEIARLAGVAATDWSWSALFADFDNDGSKDVYITNGYPKAVNDLDYQTAIFDIRRRSGSASRRAALDLLKSLHPYREPNYIFRNLGDLTFADMSAEWGVADSSFSYGAAYGDLNNDGRLDLVVSNINSPALIYENVGGGAEPPHYLQIRLEGSSPNVAGIGATVTVTAGGKKQYFEYSPYRGFMSTMDERIHVGLGGTSRVDTLEIVWPDSRRQVLTGVASDRIVTVRHADAADPTSQRVPDLTVDHYFTQANNSRGIPYTHVTGTMVDFSVQPLLPYMISRQGPALATGDLNGDGLDDVFFGAGAGGPGQVFVQRKDGSFTPTGQPFAATGSSEDWGALFFDANGDTLPDLYVAAGGYQIPEGSPLYQDRLYLNLGSGRFQLAPDALPTMTTSKAAVRAGDFTGDGRVDLFVGGRLSPRKYPQPTRSYLLRNDGGRFTDVTEQVAPELARPGGMVTDALWIDFDGDRRLDLVTAGEWMPIQFYRNEGTRLRDVTAGTRLPPARGWWYSLTSGDFNGDGRPDIMAGNLGMNYTYSTSVESPFGVYAGDFTGNQTIDVVFTQRIDGTEYPFAGKLPLGDEIYSLGLRFLTYGSFAQANISQLFTPSQMQSAVHHQTDTFASVYLQNGGNGTFTASKLPSLAQISPIRAIAAHDVDGDGNLDAIVGGNLYDTEPNTPRADAGNGLWLKGDGKGRFSPVAPSKSGLLIPRNVSNLAVITTLAGKSLLVTNTGDSVQTFAIRKR
jgi:hypothetical protein